jgi:NADPH:quinone reductase-like Zn-dependent oxidoreductase
MSWEAASAVPLVGLTVLQAFREAKLQANQHVCIVGASGGTGHVAVQLAKAMGARVTAICGHRNFEFVTQLGADSIIAYDSNKDEDSNGRGDDFVVKKLGQVCEEHGAFDVVFDTVTSQDPRDRNFNYERRIKATSSSSSSSSSRQPMSQVRLLHDRSTYICLGGVTMDWFLAHLKRFLSVDLFPRGHMLFWVRLAGNGSVCGGDLSILKTLCEQRRLAVHVNSIHPLTSSKLENLEI